MARRHEDGQPGLIDRVRWGNVGRLAIVIAAVLVIVLGLRGGDLPPTPPRAEPFAVSADGAPLDRAGRGREDRTSRAQWRSRVLQAAKRSCDAQRGRRRRAHRRRHRRRSAHTSAAAEPDPEPAPVATPPAPAPAPVTPPPVSETPAPEPEAPPPQPPAPSSPAPSSSTPSPPSSSSSSPSGGAPRTPEFL